MKRLTKDCSTVLKYYYIFTLYSIFHTNIQTEYDYSYIWTVFCKKVVAYSEYSEGVCVCMNVCLGYKKQTIQ